MANLVQCAECKAMVEPNLEAEFVFHENSTYPDYWICLRCQYEGSWQILEEGE